MRILMLRELANKYQRLLLLGSLLFLFALDLFVIFHRSFHFSSGWSLIIRNIETGRGYKACDADYIPNCKLTSQTTAMREPLPVFFFALVGRLTQDSPFAFQFSQLVFNLLVCLWIYFLTTELSNQALGVVAAFGWTFYIQAIHTVMTVNGDLIAAFFVVAGALCFIRAMKREAFWDWARFGVLFGLAVLSRSSTLLIFVVLAAGSLVFLGHLGRLVRSWPRLALAIALFGLVISPWVIRNEMVFGKPILGTTLIGYNLYRHNAILASGVFPHYVGPGEGYREVQALVARTPELRQPIDEARVDEVFQREALKIIRNHPLAYLELSVFRFLPLWFNFGVLDQYGGQMEIVDNLIVVQQALLLAAFLLAVWKGNGYLRLLAVSVLFFMLGYLAIDSQLRYMITVMPLILVISVVGMDRAIHAWIGNGRTRQYSGIISPYE